MRGQARRGASHTGQRASGGGLLLGVALATATVGSCVIGGIDLDGRHCPCAPDYVCDEASQLCTLTPGDAGSADAGDGGSGPDDGAADGEAGPEGGAPPSLYCELREAEAGVLAAPMQVVADATASNGEYVSTDLNEDGSVSFVFDVTEAGQYVLQTRVRTMPPEGSQNSFYVGLDGEAVSGDETRVFHAIPLAVVWTWDTVSLSGSAVGSEASEFDPMVWELTGGEHVLTFYGREGNTQLDQLALRQCPLEGGCTALPDDGCPAPNDGG